MFSDKYKIIFQAQTEDRMMLGCGVAKGVARYVWAVFSPQTATSLDFFGTSFGQGDLDF